MTSEEIRGMLRRSLAKSKEPDPKEVARRVLGRLTAPQRDEVAAWGLEQMATEEVRFDRMDQHTGTPAPGKSRWSSAMHDRVWVGDHWMLLGDCGIAELETIAAQYEEIAARNAAKAQEFRDLARQLEAAGARTVGELQARKAA